MREFLEKTQRVAGLRPKKRPEPGDYANFHDRLMASGLDVAFLFFLFNDLFQWLSSIIFSIFVPVLGLSYDMLFHHPPIDTFSGILNYFWESGWVTLWFVNTGFQMFFMSIPFIGSWYFLGTSPGKFLIGIEIRSTDEERSAPALWQYVMRYFSFYISIMPCFFGFLYLVMDKNNQAIHDKTAGTVVVYTQKGGIFRRGFNFIRYSLLGMEKKDEGNKKDN